MNLFDKLSYQITSVGLPLFAVSLTAVPVANTPIMLMLHWHGFRKNPDREYQLRGLQPAPVPGSVLQVNETWSGIQSLDQAMLDVAWRFGAWELEREQRRACNNVGAPEAESLACRQAFADHPFQGDGDWVAEAPDRQDLMHWGARKGYLRWVFRPVFAGIWGTGLHDDTLEQNGERKTPCPVSPAPYHGPRGTPHKYRLGRSTCIVLF